MSAVNLFNLKNYFDHFVLDEKKYICMKHSNDKKDIYKKDIYKNYFFK